MEKLCTCWGIFVEWLPKLVDFYAKNLRSSLFAGFLTLCGFLLSAMTFIVVNMKKDVFEQKWYAERVANARANGDKDEYYAPLKNLSAFLVNTVFICLFVSMSQITIGVVPHWGASLVCLIATGYGVCRIVHVVHKLKCVLTDWLSENNRVADETFKEILTKPRAKIPGTEDLQSNDTTTVKQSVSAKSDN